MAMYKCCEHCEDDPAYHEDNDPDTHTADCGHPGCRGMERVSEN